ncbi:hypothetical protein GJA_5046 [Janthinobacterium agaricidamnosum NBRC 102515 = DSM 9628]|uniref:Uncharacterized protein n=1 Tax=Janthinobacterium agaricidamnosum NBRC 102515 = DSM 9628 TaxID=1349767 RepID=W0VDA6_9BURK|nr:hypothetical protein GJA_5046 [Janthinobacterium agaricidamnosum NBRC 102515 = DSM 9628]
MKLFHIDLKRFMRKRRMLQKWGWNKQLQAPLPSVALATV